MVHSLLGDASHAMKRASYFRPVATEVNLVLSEEPTALTAVTITIDKPPAMMAYSMAVAADSFLRNCCRMFMQSSPARYSFVEAPREHYAKGTDVAFDRSAAASCAS